MFLEFFLGHDLLIHLIVIASVFVEREHVIAFLTFELLSHSHLLCRTFANLILLYQSLKIAIHFVVFAFGVHFSVLGIAAIAEHALLTSKVILVVAHSVVVEFIKLLLSLALATLELTFVPKLVVALHHHIVASVLKAHFVVLHAGLEFILELARFPLKVLKLIHFFVLKALLKWRVLFVLLHVSVLRLETLLLLGLL